MSVPTLGIREALLVRELVRARGYLVTVWQLADAIGEPVLDNPAKYRTQAIVGRIRRKFGRGVIVNERGHGYRIGRSS